MAGLGIGIAWLGYWVMFYGITQVQGGNWGFLDLGIPSRWTPAVEATARDNGSSAAAASSSSTSSTSGGGISPGPTALGPTQVNPNTSTARVPGLPVGAS